MNILFLNRHSMKNAQGGLPEFLTGLSTALTDLGHQTFLYHENETSKILNGPCTSIGQLIAFNGPFPAPRWYTPRSALKPLIALCQQQKIDIIHAQGVYRSGWLADQVSRAINIPWVITSHSDILCTQSDRMKRKKIQRRCQKILAHATAVTHLTPATADIAHALWDTRQKSYIIGNGISLASAQPFHSLPEKNYILCIGRLVPEKGFDLLIDAFAYLQKQNITISLVIAGSGNHEKSLHQQATNTGYSVIFQPENLDSLPDNSIIFTGYIRAEKKYKLLAESQCILFPTRPTQWEEPFGIVQLEAMAAGKALIASDLAAVRYLETLGLQVIRVTSDSALAWAQAIQSLLQQPIKRKAMGEENLKNVTQFDWPMIAAQYEAVYKESLETKNR